MQEKKQEMTTHGDSLRLFSNMPNYFTTDSTSQLTNPIIQLPETQTTSLHILHLKHTKQDHKMRPIYTPIIGAALVVLLHLWIEFWAPKNWFYEMFMGQLSEVVYDDIDEMSTEELLLAAMGSSIIATILSIVKWTADAYDDFFE